MMIAEYTPDPAAPWLSFDEIKRRVGCDCAFTHMNRCHAQAGDPDYCIRFEQRDKRRAKEQREEQTRKEVMASVLQNWGELQTEVARLRTELDALKDGGERRVRRGKPLKSISGKDCGGRVCFPGLGGKCVACSDDN